jgi:hypothetical protein
VVEHDDERGTGDLEDRVDVEVVLRQLVVVGMACPVEDRPRLEPR